MTARKRPAPARPSRIRRKPKTRDDAATLAHVEAAIRQLALVFTRTARADIAKLRRLHRNWPSSGDAMYRIAHDLKGQGATFGFPRISTIAAQLCQHIQQRGAASAVAANLDALTKAMPSKRS